MDLDKITTFDEDKYVELEAFYPNTGRVREAAKKVFFLVAGPLRGGGGGEGLNGCATREKGTFF